MTTQFSDADKAHMRRAFELARRALGDTRPNPAVGAVIVGADGTVLGEGYHHRAGLPHAEREALRAASGADHNVRGATMYITLEPCNHTGQTGPCTEAIIDAGLARVVIAMADPNPMASGGMARLRDAGIQVDVGLMEADALMLNPAFNTTHLLGRPMVTVKWAMTLDGCSSVGSGDSKWITGSVARREVHRRRANHDAILVGVGTVLADNPRLTARTGSPPPPGPPLLRAVLDTRLRLPLKATLFSDLPASPLLVLCDSEAPAEAERLLIEQGADVVRMNPGVDDQLDPHSVLAELRLRGVQSVYIEGGRTVAGSFLAGGLVDHVECWMAPKLAGGGVEHVGPTRMSNPLEVMSDAPELHHLHVANFGSDFLVEGWLTNHLFTPRSNVARASRGV